MKRYNPNDIEPRWQKSWQEAGIYKVAEDPAKPKKYILDFFPYLSGSAMHVGHVRNYTISDVLARFERMRGHTVLHPMGWDAFGLPAESYAIKTGKSPEEAVRQNASTFKRQLTQMGIGIDWSREFTSSDPDYYKWTQWFFKLLFDRSLAYQKESLQWWCETDKTVLANEQVEAGRCWRCGNEVTKKPLKQWFFKITDYADPLLDDLDDLDWSDSIKTIQRNWIGRSKGAEIAFKVVQPELQSQPAAVQELTVFTTRPDTLFGATFMVVAPEHPYARSLAIPDHYERVDNYILEAAKKSDIERMETDREKTGVFTGSYAVNPATNEEIPIWIADYVLAGYGTGAIMAVPAHDQRDFEFAEKFKLPIMAVIEPVTGKPQENPEFRRSIVAIVRNPKTNKYLSINWEKAGGNLFVGGGREENEDIVKTAKREILEETGYKHVELVSKTGKLHHNYFAHSKNVARRIEAHGLLFDLVDEARDTPRLETDEQGKFKVEWLNEQEVESKITDELHATSYGILVRGACYSGEGMMINSGGYDGQPSSAVREKIVVDLQQKGLATERTNYRIRDWLISRQRYWGAPIPIVHCPTDGPQAVPEDQLPVTLPAIDEYHPSDDGRSPLARVDEWVMTTCPKCGGPAKRETDTMDGFACSSWYFLRFADPKNSQKPFSHEKAKFWLPVDTYIGGAEHAVMHLLYARFWTKVMADAGLVDFTEPFTALRNQGMLLAEDGTKFSKSKNNGIKPEDLIAQGYGADSIRLVTLFLAPYDQKTPWSIQGLGGCFRFIQRAWAISQEFLESKGAAADITQSAKLTQLTHKTIKKVTEDLTHMGFNTAIAALMEFVNELYKIKTTFAPNPESAEWRHAITSLVQLLAPFAPHISEELWHQLGHETSVHLSEWPTWDRAVLTQQNVKIVVQINGKVRDVIEAAADVSEEEVKAQALASTKVQASLGDSTPRRIIYVRGRLVNIVT